MKENKGMLQIIKRIENMKKQAQFYFVFNALSCIDKDTTKTMQYIFVQL